MTDNPNNQNSELDENIDNPDGQDQRLEKITDNLSKSNQEMIPDSETESPQSSIPLQSLAPNINPNFRSRANNKISYKTSSFAVSVALFIAAIGFVLYSIQPWNTLKNINVNSDQLSRVDIENAINIKAGDRLSSVSSQLNALTAKAKANDSRIKDISFNLENDQLNVNVQEYVTPGFLIKNGKTYQLDLDGSKSLFNENIPIGSTIYTGFKSDEILKEVIDNYAKLPYVVRRDLSQIKFAPNKDNSKRVIFYMNDQNIVYANTGDFAKKFKYYPEIAVDLDQPSVVDLQTNVYSRPMEESDRNN